MLMRRWVNEVVYLPAAGEDFAWARGWNRGIVLHLIAKQPEQGLGMFV
jgi:hypothetical protein